ncbi:hypothetical protein CFC21_019652 [Triticum aestivum]|uniref:GATA-type domain-containing protein n=2 Tax=Triticum aestivum TaxID=4565 RepID=A0A9R1E646_WHEAT|nr:hypothetical protein CFC21_019652 [Triticum aestivum]
MRQPFFSLDDQRIDECDGDGLPWPDDAVDEALISSLPVLDDRFLEALGVDCSPPAPMDVDVHLRLTQSPAAGRKTNSGGAFPLWDVPTKPRRQPAAARKRPWSHPSVSFGVPAVHEAPPAHGGHGVSADNAGVFSYGSDIKPSKLSYGGDIKPGKLSLSYSSDGGSKVDDMGGGRRRSAGRKREQAPEGQECGHCHTTETPQWRNGPDGPATLCNACGIRYRMGRDKLVPEYRPSTSPFFRSGEHSNRNSKVQKLREKKVKALKLYGDGGGSGAPGGAMTTAKVAGNVDISSVL